MKSTEVTEALTKQQLKSQRKIIQTKTNEIKELLEKEQVETPLELTGKAQKIFEKTRKEIIDSIGSIEKLGGDISKVKVWKRSKVGPFMEKQKKVDLKDPRIQERIKYVDKMHKEIEDRKKIPHGSLDVIITR